MKKNEKIIVFICFLIAALLGVVAYAFPDYFHYGELFMGMAGGLVCFIITYVIMLIDSSVPKHHEKTIEIYDIVHSRNLILEDTARKRKQSEFYSEKYKNAKEIKISGIANKALIDGLFANIKLTKILSETISSNNKTIVKDLLNKFPDHLFTLMKKDAIRVEILMMDPRCDIIKYMDMHEPNGKKNYHFSTIANTLLLIKLFCQKVNHIDLMTNSILTVRLCNIPLNTTIFYAKYDDKPPVLLMGMLYAIKHGEDSQIFSIPNFNDSESLFNDCLNNFDSIYEKSILNQILILSNEEISFDNEIYNDITHSKAKVVNKDLVLKK